MEDFIKFSKIPRYSRDCIITEKIDGTNAQILIQLLNDKTTVMDSFKEREWPIIKEGRFYFGITPGSRNRWITPKKDNYNFAQWVWDNQTSLFDLGPGRHFGEWWGSGIQRRYGLEEKRFSLFNVGKWNEENCPSCCHVVPVLCEGVFHTTTIESILHDLEAKGSQASPGFMDPEGIVIFHSASGNLFKKTIKDDEKPKGQGEKDV